MSVEAAAAAAARVDDEGPSPIAAVERPPPGRKSSFGGDADAAVHSHHIHGLLSVPGLQMGVAPRSPSLRDGRDLAPVPSPSPRLGSPRLASPMSSPRGPSPMVSPRVGPLPALMSLRGTVQPRVPSPERLVLVGGSHGNRSGSILELHQPKPSEKPAAQPEASSELPMQETASVEVAEDTSPMAVVDASVDNTTEGAIKSFEAVVKAASEGSSTAAVSESQRGPPPLSAEQLDSSPAAATAAVFETWSPCSGRLESSPTSSCMENIMTPTTSMPVEMGYENERQCQARLLCRSFANAAQTLQHHLLMCLKLLGMMLESAEVGKRSLHPNQLRPRLSQPSPRLPPSITGKLDLIGLPWRPTANSSPHNGVSIAGDSDAVQQQLMLTIAMLDAMLRGALRSTEVAHSACSGLCADRPDWQEDEFVSFDGTLTTVYEDEDFETKCERVEVPQELSVSREDMDSLRADYSNIKAALAKRHQERSAAAERLREVELEAEQLRLQLEQAELEAEKAQAGSPGLPPSEEQRAKAGSVKGNAKKGAAEGREPQATMSRPIATSSPLVLQVPTAVASPADTAAKSAAAAAAIEGGSGEEPDNNEVEDADRSVPTPMTPSHVPAALPSNQPAEAAPERDAVDCSAAAAGAYGAAAPAAPRLIEAEVVVAEASEDNDNEEEAEDAELVHVHASPTAVPDSHGGHRDAFEEEAEDDRIQPPNGQLSTAAAAAAAAASRYGEAMNGEKVVLPAPEEVGDSAADGFVGGGGSSSSSKPPQQGKALGRRVAPRGAQAPAAKASGWSSLDVDVAEAKLQELSSRVAEVQRQYRDLVAENGRLREVLASTKTPSLAGSRSEGILSSVSAAGIGRKPPQHPSGSPDSTASTHRPDAAALREADSRATRRHGGPPRPAWATPPLPPPEAYSACDRHDGRPSSSPSSAALESRHRSAVPLEAKRAAASRGTSQDGTITPTSERSAPAGMSRSSGSLRGSREALGPRSQRGSRQPFVVCSAQSHRGSMSGKSSPSKEATKTPASRVPTSGKTLQPSSSRSRLGGGGGGSSAVSSASGQSSRAGQRQGGSTTAASGASPAPGPSEASSPTGSTPPWQQEGRQVARAALRCAKNPSDGQAMNDLMNLLESTGDGDEQPAPEPLPESGRASPSTLGRHAPASSSGSARSAGQQAAGFPGHPRSAPKRGAQNMMPPAPHMAWSGSGRQRHTVGSPGASAQYSRSSQGSPPAREEGAHSPNAARPPLAGHPPSEESQSSRMSSPQSSPSKQRALLTPPSDRLQRPPQMPQYPHMHAPPRRQNRPPQPPPQQSPWPPQAADQQEARSHPSGAVAGGHQACTPPPAPNSCEAVRTAGAQDSTGSPSAPRPGPAVPFMLKSASMQHLQGPQVHTLSRGQPHTSSSQSLPNVARTPSPPPPLERSPERSPLANSPERTDYSPSTNRRTIVTAGPPYQMSTSPGRIVQAADMYGMSRSPSRTSLGQAKSPGPVTQQIASPVYAIVEPSAAGHATPTPPPMVAVSATPPVPRMHNARVTWPTPAMNAQQQVQPPVAPVVQLSIPGSAVRPAVQYMPCTPVPAGHRLPTGIEMSHGMHPTPPGQCRQY
mmetsp:Transcript_71348/g.170843  ORF Transcript_71348/g.170843 Transcript_71348/m.170843 type:complete len:1596 (+) Transcript_71348:49-4836(+)